MTSLPSPGSPPVKGFSGYSRMELVEVVSSSTNHPNKYPWSTVNDNTRSCHASPYQERSTNHNFFVETVRKSRQYRHWKWFVACIVWKWHRQQQTQFPWTIFPRLLLWKALYLHRRLRRVLRLQDRRFCYIAESPEESKLPKAIDKSMSLFGCTLMLYFSASDWCLDPWVVWMKDLESGVHLQKQTVYRHIVGFHEDWSSKSLCPESDSLNMTFLLWFISVCFSLWIMLVSSLNPESQRPSPEGISSFVTRGNTSALGACRPGSLSFTVAKLESWGGW